MNGFHAPKIQKNNLTFATKEYMWVILSFTSALLLGLYDLAKKRSLQHNAVIPVLFLNTAFGGLFFFSLICASRFGWISNDLLYVPKEDFHAHILIVLKAFLVLGSWMLGYFGIKHLPITLAGPINATRPVMVLIGATLIFGERLNLLQWLGVGTAIISFYLLSLSGRKEGVHFSKDRWIWMVVGAAVLGAICGLYDKYLMKHYAPMFVQSWYTVYQMIIMGAILSILWWPKRKETTPFSWRWSIPLITIFLTIADFAYFYALKDQTALVSVVSMIRRGSVLVSFFAGAMLFREKNIKSKAFDLALVFISLMLLWFGSR